MTDRRMSWKALNAVAPPQQPVRPAPEPIPEPTGLPDSGSLPKIGRLPKSDRLPKSGSLSDSERLKIEKHYAALLHSVTDVLLPTLPAAAQVVYLQLYRLSYGHGRNTCRIGHPRLAERANMSPSTVRAALAQLQKRELISVIQYRFGGAEQGTTYEIHLPPETPEDAVSLVKSDSPPKIGRLPKSDSPPDSGTMKSHENKHEKGSVYEIRTIAARLFEAHRGDPDFDHDRLRDLVRDALIGQGRQLEAEAIEEAIRGMAV